MKYSVYCMAFLAQRPNLVTSAPSERTLIPRSFVQLKLQLREISIRHFQYGGVCLHFTRASFNTVFGKSNFKITLIFSEMTLHFNYIV